MKNKLTIITAVLAVVAIISGIVFFVSGGDKAPVKKDEPPVAYSYEQSEYTMSENLSVKGSNGEIYLPTDFENIYFTADIKGAIRFYEYTNGQMVSGNLTIKQVKANLAATYETIPVTINYIEKDGKACGYGIFTSDMSADVDVYSYAFVKLTAKPSGYGEGYLLLADFDKNNFYKADKIYSEIYNFDLSNGKTSTYVSNNTRLIDRNGSFRQDWSMLTDDFIKNLGNANYFFSSRYYNENDKGKRADIMELSNAYRPKVVLENILGTWFVNDANGMHYLKKNENGFANMCNDRVLTQFEGDYFLEYMQSGNYLINKKSLEIINLLTGEIKTLKDINIASADIFSISPDGTKAVFASYGEMNENGTPIQTVIYCTTDNSVAPVIFSEPMLFDESAGFIWIDGGFMSARALDSTGAKVGSVVYSY